MPERKSMTNKVVGAGQKVLATDAAQGVIGAVADKMEDAAEIVKEQGARAGGRKPNSKRSATTRKTGARKTGARKITARKPGARKTTDRKTGARKTTAAARPPLARPPLARPQGRRRPQERSQDGSQEDKRQDGAQEAKGREAFVVVSSAEGSEAVGVGGVRYALLAAVLLLAAPALAATWSEIEGTTKTDHIGHRGI